MANKASNKNIFVLVKLGRACAAFWLFFFAAAQFLYAQPKPAGEYQVKAAFLYNFTRFVEWPPDAFSSIDAPFIIGIAGDNPFGTFLEEIVKGEKISGHPTTIQYYPKAEDIQDCHILFINMDEAVKIKKVIGACGQRSVLTVGDSGYFTRWGGIVRFFREGKKIKLEINTASAKAAQLKISSKLLNLARIY